MIIIATLKKLAPIILAMGLYGAIQVDWPWHMNAAVLTIFLLGWVDGWLKNHQELKLARQTLQAAEEKITKITAEASHRQEGVSDYVKNLSQEVIDKKYQHFQHLTEQNLTKILNPLRENLKVFQKKVEDTYSQESRERFALKESIKELSLAHAKLEGEAQSLTQALKGDVKAQGGWGEMILSAILKNSGLVENEHYITQGRDLNLKDEDGKRQKPDVIIKLPDKKHLVIDAKVSLTHYEQFISSDHSSEKTKYLSLFLKSLRIHVNQLSEKTYYLADSIDAPDFTMMFFPIEGAFSLALQNDRGLFDYSWRRSIVIVSPTTLLATLKTVDSMWKRDKQNRHAMEIASMGGTLYDKFVSFAKDMETIDSSLEKARHNYKTAFSKLYTGPGNIVSKLDKIKMLGARATKQIPDHIGANPQINSSHSSHKT